MRRHQVIKDVFLENRTFLSRTVIIFLAMSFLLFGLVIRLIYLQVSGHDKYHSMATNNRIKIRSTPPTRGIIYDKKGRVLAENLPSYSLEIIPEQVKDMQKTLLRLQKLLTISEEKMSAFHKHRRRYRRFDSIPLLLKLSVEDVAKFAVVRHTFSGVDIEARLIRHYPYKELTAHVVGYVGRINDKELKRVSATEYRSLHFIGKTGIEASYEDILRGYAGYSEIEMNAQGRSVTALAKVMPIPGADLYLSLDIELQKIAYEALATLNGAVVALDLKTGGVIVQVSKASFDPNLFVSGISHKDYNRINHSKDMPLFDRVLRGRYPPGSTLKPFIALAGLENNVVTAKQTLFCPGYYQLPHKTHKYRDWKKRGHGVVNLDKAIVQSCDVYFYDMALALGIDNLANFLNGFGFGQKSGIDLNGENSGLVATREWKRIHKHDVWYPGETLITGIGQGFTQVTPLQLAYATGILANSGKAIVPFLVERKVYTDREDELNHVQAKKLNLNDKNLTVIKKAMVRVIHSVRGTARLIAGKRNYQIAGKTGTAQVYSIKQGEKYNEKEIAFNMRDHALFIAYAPVDDPKIAVAVIVEHGRHGGSIAAPIAAAVITQYLKEGK
jgi:penicillin-binding protein 2